MGRPPIEAKYPDLPDVLVSIAKEAGAADLRRRSLTIGLPRSLDHMVDALRKRGILVT